MLDLAKQASKLIRLLIALCCVLTFGCLINLIFDVSDMLSIGFPSNLEASGNVWCYLIITFCSDVLDAVVLVVFVSFALVVARKGEIFSKGQTYRLLVIAILMLVQAALGLLVPSISLSSFQGYEAGAAVGPTLDLRQLSTSIMFFIFAAISEYGRILQEDSDNIL